MQNGLTSAEAADRLKTVGPNEIRHEAGEPWWKKLFGQFTSPMILLLLGAAGLSAVLKQVGDAVAIAVTAVALGVYAWALHARDLGEARNLAFSTIVFAELFRTFASRSPTKVFWEVGAFSNLRVLGVVLGSATAQIAIHHVPMLERLFDIGPLSMADCALTVGLGLIPVTVIEVSKLVARGLHIDLGRERVPA